MSDGVPQDSRAGTFGVFRVGAAVGLAVVVGLGGCASVSASDPETVQLDGVEHRVSARAERGATADHLFVTIDGVDVADGPFGPAEAAGTVLRGSFEGRPVEARCGHRWRPGIHIGYRCHVTVGRAAPVALDF